MNDPLPSAPRDHDAESRIIGIVTHYPEALAARFCTELTAADFDHPHHTVFAALINELHAKEIAPAIDTVTKLCVERGHKEYVITLMDAGAAAMPPGFFDATAARVRKVARQRNAWRAGLEMVRRLSESDLSEDTDALIAQHADSLAAMAGSNEAGENWHSIPDLWGRALDEIEAAATGQTKAGAERLPYGVEALDKIVEGGERGRLLVIGAQRHVGKTAIARAVACAMAKTYSVGWFGMESSAAEEGMWTLAHATGIALHTLRQGMLREGEFRDLVSAFSHAKEKLRLHLDDTPDLTVSMVASRARALKRKRGLDVLLVDYVQLLTPASAAKNMSREQMVSEDARRLKVLARQLDCHVIALAQVNDEIGPDDAPEMRHFRESKSLANHADAVLMMSAPDGIAPEEPGQPTARDLWIRKWRGVGAQSRPVRLLLHGSTQRFTERTDDDSRPEKKERGGSWERRRSA